MAVCATVRICVGFCANRAGSAERLARLWGRLARLVERAPRAHVVRVVALVIAFATCSCKRTTSEPEPGEEVVRVAAASDLGAAFPVIAEAFTRESHVRVELTFGSSGVLAKQVTEGAPFDLFASADASYADAVVASGVCDGATSAPYARGTLVLVCPAGAPNDLASLADAKVRTVAVASPEHAPYGRAAMDALARAGLATTLRPKLVFAGNVGESLQFARSGNADCAFASKALVGALPPAQVLSVPRDGYAPLVQTMVACGTSTKGHARAAAFSAFVRGPEGRRILASYGFELPEPKP